MSDAKPVESKIEAAAKVVDAAVSLTSPATAPVAAAKIGWWALKNPKRWAFLAAGAAVGIAGGVYEFKHFKADPGQAAAQTESPMVAQKKAEDAKKPDNVEVPPLDMGVRNVKLPAPNTKDTVIPPPLPALDLDIPDVKPPGNDKTGKNAPPKPGNESSELNLTIPLATPSSKPTTTGANDTEPPLIVPPSSIPDPNEKKPAARDTDQFKASPEALPATMTDRKDKNKKDTGPVLRIGGIEPMPPSPPPTPMKKDEPPPIPNIDLTIPSPSPMPVKKDEPPPIPNIGIKIPTSPTDPKKTDDVPPVVAPLKTGPSPMPMKQDDPPAPPIIEAPTLKLPMSSDPPTIKSPMIGDPPPPPPLIGDKPAKKDNYDEDWHTQKQGETYTMISQEYLHDTKYATALEAYNKEHRKSGERIIRVPPTWVLEEQFASLIGSKADQPEAKTASKPKFDPVVPRPSRERVAPPPPATPVGNDEYRVKAEAGETIREIARKIYGDPNSWRKLWDLNPNLDPTQPIPNGTALRIGK